MESYQIDFSSFDTPQGEDKILKCPECYNIPEISENWDGYYKFKCRNNHSDSLKLNELLNKCLASETYKCSFGKEISSQDIYLLFNFCFKCKKIICSEKKCQKAHKNECDNTPGNFIPCKNLNSLCYDHGEKLFFYCPECDINVCEKCEGHEEHNIKFMNKMKIDDKEIKLFNYKIEFSKLYLNYIEKEIDKFKKEWKEDFEKNMKNFEKSTKIFLDKNRKQIELMENILNTYKIKGNICIENYKNIKTFSKIEELKFNIPVEINEKKKYIDDFCHNNLIKERYSEKEEERKYGILEEICEKLENVDTKTTKIVLEKLNKLFEINKIEKEENILIAIEYVLNNYLKKNEVFIDETDWYEDIINDLIWDIINYLPNL